MSDDNTKTVHLPSITKELTAVKTIDRKDLESYLGLNMDKYEHLQISPEAAKKYKQHISALRHGMHTGIPLLCVGGRKCPLDCPLTLRNSQGMPDYDSSVYPIHEKCPIESDMIRLHIIDLCVEYGIEPTDVTDLAIVSKLASLDVLEYRVNMALAKDAEGIIISEVTHVDPRTGNEYIAKKAHPAFEVLERVHRMKQDLLKSMIGTRREKIKAAAITGEKAASTSLTNTMNSILDKMRRSEPDIIDAHYEHSVSEDEPDQQ